MILDQPRNDPEMLLMLLRKMPRPRGGIGVVAADQRPPTREHEERLNKREAQLAQREARLAAEDRRQASEREAASKAAEQQQQLLMSLLECALDPEVGVGRYETEQPQQPQQPQPEAQPPLPPPSQPQEVQPQQSLAASQPA